MAEQQKDNSKEIKKQLESYVSVLTHKLGRAPTLEEVQYALSDGQAADAQKSRATPDGQPATAGSEPLAQPTADAPVAANDGEGSMDLSEGEEPAIANMKVYYGMSGEGNTKQPDPFKVLYYEDPGKLFYNCKTKEWTDARPEVLDHLSSRDMTNQDQDILYAIMHGVMSDSDYSKLSNAGMVSGTAQTLWDKMQLLKSQLDQYHSMQKSEDSDEDDIKSPTQPEAGSGLVEGLKSAMGGDEQDEDQAQAVPGVEGVPSSVIQQIVENAQKAALLSIEKSVREIVRDELDKMFAFDDGQQEQTVEGQDYQSTEELHKENKVAILD